MEGKFHLSGFVFWSNLDVFHVLMTRKRAGWAEQGDAITSIQSP